MQLKLIIKILTILGLLLNPIQLIVADIFEECEGIASGTFVSSLTDCATYIYCDADESLSGQCDDGYYFDGEGCDVKENVVCSLDMESEPETEENPDTEEPITTIMTTIRPTTTSTVVATTSPAAIDDGTTTSTSMIFDALTIPPIVKDRCPTTDDLNHIILIGNSNSCTDYYLCYHGHAIEMHCTDHLHFNAYTGKCDFPENVHCLNDRPSANKCLAHITDFFPHPENCNYFYYCIKGFMTVQQCPFYYGWDVEKRSCVHISQAKCYSSAKKRL